jgi:hypothetical protein
MFARELTDHGGGKRRAGIVSFGVKNFALRFVRWGRRPMTVDDCIVASILIVIILWVLVKMMPPKNKS